MKKETDKERAKREKKGDSHCKKANFLVFQEFLDYLKNKKALFYRFLFLKNILKMLFYQAL
ncbi:hypothetical protein HSIEG1_1630 [Enterococcus sp. HSIEG1]|nr:hypothetical protein HSIEG1_1630 [Enterococcus sp. HSIEG1]